MAIWLNLSLNDNNITKMWNNNINNGNGVEETMECSLETSNLVNGVTNTSTSTSNSSVQLQINDPKGISELCRVCLISCNSHNHKSCSLFVSNGKCAQLWVKVMACAWVQVFEGDGLPTQICAKCHSRLDIAYQFKQQCEAADARLRQMIGNRSTDTKISEIEQLNRPIRSNDYKHPCFDVAGECLDLVQSDINALSMRPSSTDASLPPIDFKMKENNQNSLKREPEFINNLNMFIPLNLQNDVVASFKCENFNENDILNNLPTKLFDSVDDHIDNDSDDDGNIDSKLEVWKNQENFIENEILLSVSKQNDICDISESQNLTVNQKMNDLQTINTVNHILNEIKNDLSNQKTAHINNQSTINNEIEKNNEINAINHELVTSNNRNDIEKMNGKKIAQRKTEIKVSNNSKETQCELCGKVFKHKNYMNEHLRTHSRDKPFECAQCDQKFSSNLYLIKHSRTHLGDRPYVCTACGKSFIQSASLKCHMRVHTGEKPFVCEICSKRFSQQSNLFIHKQIHTGRRDFHCNVCDISFKLYKHLQSHMKLHSEEKKFSCSICHKKFHRKSALSGHLSIHSGEKPYKCELCGHAFANSSNLKAHIRVHSGVRPYFCKVCKKSFTQSSGLNRHMQQHPMEKSKSI